MRSTRPYGLRRRADWRRIFGPSSARYPGTYTPRPSSRRHVLHLGHWYAQSHPTEDFAETFAVWLQPKARWRRDYAEWPGAIEKLEFVNTLMDEIAGSTPHVRDRGSIEPLSESDKTLGEHYRRKRARYDRIERRYDAWLMRDFATRPARPRAVQASRFIREIEPQLRRLLVRRARLHPYLVDHAIATICAASSNSISCCAIRAATASVAWFVSTSASCSTCCAEIGRDTRYEAIPDSAHHARGAGAHRILRRFRRREESRDRVPRVFDVDRVSAITCE